MSIDRKIKPIFVVKVPSIYTKVQGASIRDHFNNYAVDLRRDYHIMMMDCQPVEEITFECYNVSDVDEINFKKFKEIIENK